MSARRRWVWIVLAVFALLVAAGVLRALSARKEQAQTQAQASAPPKPQTEVELASTDVLTARTRELAQGLVISGSLRAVSSAVVKARVAGELQGLLVREGDAVKVGQELARVDPTEYLARSRQAREQADSAKAQIDIAQRQYDNNKALVDQGFISRTALDSSWSTLVGAQATHKAALAALDVANKAVDDAVLRAPISGVVSQRLSQPGERVAIDGRVVEIVDLSRIELEAMLPPADSVAVRVGQPARLQIEGSPQPVAARVVRISPAAQAGSRSVLVYLALEPAPGLRQGLFAQGSLDTARQRALAVPVSAVRTDKPQPYVQVVRDTRIAHVAVQLGERGEADGEPMVAVGGLEDGAVVVAGSVGTLREGTAVRYTRAAATVAAQPAAAVSAAVRP